jgi:hypothetical protein
MSDSDKIIIPVEILEDEESDSVASVQTVGKILREHGES